MKKLFLFFCFLLSSYFSWSQSDKIKVYFNRPVNNNLASISNAVYLNQLIDDTIIAYINRAKYTLDLAVYSFSETAAISSIVAAINNAYSRGVAIRWIYDGSSTNTSLTLLNSNINKLASPTSQLYGIMHNKFMIIDGSSSNPNDPIVWTGSTNFTSAQINTDANNVVIIQDALVAQAYTTEFNEMWGSTSITPNAANAKFGPDKTDNTTHIFNVGGEILEVYFSPSDGTNSKIQQAIRSADVDMYFGVYSFTVAVDADSINKRIQNNVYVAGILDPTSQSYPPYTTLSSSMGTNLIKDILTGLYHNKMLIVDPSAPDSDPLVLTGSHNWSASADTKNDENTVIIHSANIANVYYQSFYQNFTDEGGTLNIQTGVNAFSNQTGLKIYPNPSNDRIFISDATDYHITNLKIINIQGKIVKEQLCCQLKDSVLINVQDFPNGIYFIQLQTNIGIITDKFIVNR
ncbi:MAG: T9SS type A sorting domain-containing protein [Bacteroidetes bacterium]|nr:T9SS type A sorting domain-containing protein [Bacteroidota bacterium]